jgi:hypothetical protein
MAKSANWRGPPAGYITSAEAAQRSGYSNNQILILVNTGRLVARLVGNRWFIDELALDAFVANRKTRP